MSEPIAVPDTSKTGLAGFGPNEWLVDELYQRYLDDKDSVDSAWWDFFEDYHARFGTPETVTAGGPNGSRSATTAPAPTEPAGRSHRVSLPVPVLCDNARLYREAREALTARDRNPNAPGPDYYDYFCFHISPFLSSTA